MNYQHVLQQIRQSDVYQRNIQWGEPRPGHPEGTIAAHIEDLERNLERLSTKVTESEYWRLKILIYVHDTFKPEAPEGMPISDPGSHASRARLFLSSFCNDPQLLTIVQFHDEHLALWQKVKRRGQFDRVRFEKLLQAIIDWDIHLAFIIVDGCTPGKSREPLVWFFRKIKNKVQSKWTEKDILKIEVFESSAR